MSLNDIQLSPSQLVDLYGHHLLIDNQNEAPAAPKASTSPTPTAAAHSTPPAETPASKEPLPAAPKTPAPKPLQYLGKNQKKIGILVDYAKEVYLPESDLNFLTNILQACRLNLGDVAIVNYAHHPLQPGALRAQLPMEHLLVFGAPVTEPALQALAPFTPLPQNGCTIILAPPLGQLNNNSPEGKLLKTKLWACLKQLFNV